MLIATDGACKRLGKPDCTATGVAWIQTEDGNFCFKSHFETESTSQRGEIYGLIEGLKYALVHRQPNEDIIIITDSEYLLNTVMLEWCWKWKYNGWIAGSGEPAKNADLWEIVCTIIDDIGRDHVQLQWTKGHLAHYTPGNVKQAMRIDTSGLELYSRVMTIANRPSEYNRIVEDFNYNRQRHDKYIVPAENAIIWVIANVMADLIAGYVQDIMDTAYLAQRAEAINL